MEPRRRPVGTIWFHAARWRLEPLLTPAVTMFIVLLAALLYIGVTSSNMIVAGLFVLFLLGLAWSVYATLHASGRSRSRKG